MLHEFDSNGKLIQMKDGLNNPRELMRNLRSVGDKSVLILSKQSKFPARRLQNQIENFQNELEKMIGLEKNSLHLTSLSDTSEAWSLIVDMENPNDNFQESFDLIETPEDMDGTQTELLKLQKGNIVFQTRNSNSHNGFGIDELFVHVVDTNNNNQHVVEVIDDVSSWQVGDQIVITSTDFDWEQAEILTLEKVNRNIITLNGNLLYPHFGKIIQDVDMRAEVGVLTRNVKIHGEMEDQCYDTELNKCRRFPFDTFGGQTKALEGFKSYNIEGAEIYHMGQATILSSYPIHFHLNRDTIRNNEPSMIKGEWNIEVNYNYWIFTREYVKLLIIF